MPRARSTRSATKPGQLRLLGVPQRPKRKATRHGGPREGAGRKPKNGKTAGVSHLQRPKQSRHVPLHITIRLCDGLPSMRRRRGYKLAQRAMALANRFEEARLCHLSIQRNHLHLIIEADDQAALTRAMRSFGVSLAKNVKHELRRPGRMRIFADRYHIEKLTTPAQVRNALAYVLGNWRKHGEDRDIPGPPPRMDRYSSGPYFTGWDTGPPPQVIRFDALPFPEDGPLPIRFPTSYLLRQGWQRHGLISPWHRPGSRRR
jgi:putative transposase